MGDPFPRCCTRTGTACLANFGMIFWMQQPPSMKNKTSWAYCLLCTDRAQPCYHLSHVCWQCTGWRWLRATCDLAMVCAVHSAYTAPVHKVLFTSQVLTRASYGGQCPLELPPGSQLLTTSRSSPSPTSQTFRASSCSGLSSSSLLLLLLGGRCCLRCQDFSRWECFRAGAQASSRWPVRRL